MSVDDRPAGRDVSDFGGFRDDAELVFAAKAGEHWALIELYDRHSAKVLRTTYRITKNHHDAEDAMQDAFLSAFAHIGKFDGRAQFSSWLLRIAINSSLGILRKRRTRPESSIDGGLDSDTSFVWELADSSADTEGHYLLHERRTLLGKAIERLRPSLRNIVEIQQSNDRSVKETAEVAGLSVAATKSKLLRAKHALRRIMC